MNKVLRKIVVFGFLSSLLVNTSFFQTNAWWGEFDDLVSEWRNLGTLQGIILPSFVLGATLATSLYKCPSITNIIDQNKLFPATIIGVGLTIYGIRNIASKVIYDHYISLHNQYSNEIFGECLDNPLFKMIYTKVAKGMLRSERKLIDIESQNNLKPMSQKLMDASIYFSRNAASMDAYYTSLWNAYKHNILKERYGNSGLEEETGILKKCEHRINEDYQNFLRNKNIDSITQDQQRTVFHTFRNARAIIIDSYYKKLDQLGNESYDKEEILEQSIESGREFLFKNINKIFGSYFTAKNYYIPWFNQAVESFNKHNQKNNKQIIEDFSAERFTDDLQDDVQHYTNLLYRSKTLKKNLNKLLSKGYHVDKGGSYEINKEITDMTDNLKLMITQLESNLPTTSQQPVEENLTDTID